MNTSLCKVYEDYFPIGAAVVPETLLTHTELVTGQFNSLTAGNQMKPEELHPTEHVYDFTQGDLIADFAGSHGMKLRGHTLVWHNQTPAWFFKDGGRAASPELVRKRLKEHIGTVLGHYRGRAYAWDVLNEAISDKESEPMLRKTPWLAALGDSYMAQAFEFAAEANSAAQLYYNDYNACEPVKARRIYKLVKSLLEQGVPVHGVGIQGHWNIYRPHGDDIRRAIELYASLGVSVQITELDVSLFEFDDATAYAQPPAELLALQAERYGEFFEIFREYRGVISGVTLWGVADDASWLSNFPFKGRKNWPLLFDDRHRPKEAFQRVVTF